MSTVNLSPKANHAQTPPSVAVVSRVPVLECWISRPLLKQPGPICNAPSFDARPEGKQAVSPASLVRFYQRRGGIECESPNVTLARSGKHFPKARDLFRKCSDFSNNRMSVKNVTRTKNLSFQIRSVALSVQTASVHGGSDRLGTPGLFFLR